MVVFAVTVMVLAVAVILVAMTVVEVAVAVVVFAVALVVLAAVMMVTKDQSIKEKTRKVAPMKNRDSRRHLRLIDKRSFNIIRLIPSLISI